MGILGIFEKVADGEKCLKDFKAGLLKEFPASSKKLVSQFKIETSDKATYTKLFGGNDEAI
jgi:hypothetical protein